ncbi:MAG TPA: ABC transporter substrate binding protein, partial [Methylomirabilota bacterium]|nr:ABC transporter substrate binding protein [Methylomirabilota bacterium]
MHNTTNVSRTAIFDYRQRPGLAIGGLMVMRAVVAGLGTAVLLLLTAPLVAEAHAAGPPYRIGVLLNAAPHIVSGYEVFADALRDAGYVQGRNLVLTVRYPERYEELPSLAADLAGMRPDVLVTFGTPPLAAAKGATQTIPIVGVAMGDPERYIASLARPGGNITGLSSVDPGRAEKHLDLVKQAMPKLSRIAVLW